MCPNLKGLIFFSLLLVVKCRPISNELQTSTTINDDTTFNSTVQRPSHNKSRSLYEELESTSSFYPSVETSSEVMKFESSRITDDNSKSDELSMEKKFEDIRKNTTVEERHSLDEAMFDEQSIKYTSLNKTIFFGSGEDDSIYTTATTSKKGKYLDLILPNDDNNMNASEMQDVDTRKPDEIDVSRKYIDQEVSLNITAKNLLDWSEITKMDNQDTQDLMLSATATVNDATLNQAMTEKREFKTKILLETPITTSSISKMNAEDYITTTVSSIEDLDLTKGSTNHEDSEIVLVGPVKIAESKKTHESLRFEGDRFTNDIEATTALSGSFTTESFETTTMENFDTTTSIVDTFTVIGEDGEHDNYKRTIMLPSLTTEQPIQNVSTTQSSHVTGITNDKVQMKLTQEFTHEYTTMTPYSFTEFPESTQTYSNPSSTKSMSSLVVTTDSLQEMFDSTTTDYKILATSQPKTMSSQQYDNSFESSTSGFVEVFEEEKFKYSTLLPENADITTWSFEEATSMNPNDSNKENLDGEIAYNGRMWLLISLSIVAALTIIGISYFLLKRRNKQNFSQRCRPVGLDAYSLDNVSVYNSVRRKAQLRLSKRSYGNSAFEDPSLQSNVLDFQSLQEFSKNKSLIQNEFKLIPQVSVRVSELPDNCESKNRYANVLPQPETRVHLQRMNNDDTTEYINANFVKGPKDITNYYIATQAPLESTIVDFWRMIWEQNSKVIIMATDLTENGVERSAQYIPSSVVLDNSQIFGSFQVTLKSREVKGKYAVSQIHLKNLSTNTWREIMHLWYQWPENGCPTDESSVINLLLEARSFLRTSLPEQLDENCNTELSKNAIEKDKLSTLEKTKSLQRVQGPLTVHCSPGTGRTGTIIACDLTLRLLETPPKKIDIPQIVYYVRKGRANAIRTQDQYEFIYHIANAYATKLNSLPSEN